MGVKNTLFFVVKKNNIKSNNLKTKCFQVVFLKEKNYEKTRYNKNFWKICFR